MPSRLFGLFCHRIIAHVRCGLHERFNKTRDFINLKYINKGKATFFIVWATGFNEALTDQ